MDYFDILLAKKLNGGGGGDITIEDLYVNANGEYRAPSGKAYGKVTANVPAPSNAIFKQTLTGLPSPIATFTGADAPIDSLKASIVGVQDLHGYDSPWPAGGGKNKFDINACYSGHTISGNSITINGGGYYYDFYQQSTGDSTAISSSTIYDKLPNLSAGTHTLSFASGPTLVIYSVASNLSVTKLGEATYNTPFTFTLESGSRITLRRKTNSAGTYTNIQLEGGSTATAFAPYSNICPISGWSSCDVTVTDDLISPTYTRTYTIPFKDSSDNPITVYGGGIDVTGGSWLNNRLFEVFDNTATVTFGRDSQPNWYYQIAGTSTGTSGETAETISNMYSYANIGNDNDNLGIMKMPNGNIRLRVGGTQPATVDDFVNSLGITPLQVVSKLATPQTGIFTPVNIRSNGVTNISVNCGNVTELKYYSETP